MSDDAPDLPQATDGLQEVLAYRFIDPALLERALTHSSYANEKANEKESEHESGEDNERLEFLGDSVIGMVAAQLLYRAHPDWREGELTRALHQLVDRRGLASLARELGLGDYLRLGRTELSSAGRSKENILADAMEAVIGAMYLDGGLEPVEALARRSFRTALQAGASPVGPDPKTKFQEWSMQVFGVFPTYRLAGDTGVEGDEERFTSELVILDHAVAAGVGRSKRESERAAAVDATGRREAIRDALEGLEPDGEDDADQGEPRG